MCYVIQRADGMYLANSNLCFTPFAAFAQQFSQERADQIVQRDPRFRKLLVITGNFPGYDGRPTRITNWRAA